MRFIFHLHLVHYVMIYKIFTFCVLGSKQAFVYSLMPSCSPGVDEIRHSWCQNPTTNCAGFGPLYFPSVLKWTPELLNFLAPQTCPAEWAIRSHSYLSLAVPPWPIGDGHEENSTNFIPCMHMDLVLDLCYSFCTRRNKFEGNKQIEKNLNDQRDKAQTDTWRV